MDNRDDNHNIEATKALIQRILPHHANQFKVDITSGSPDFFEVKPTDGHILLIGSTPVAAASGLNWYLKYICHCHISWNSNQLDLPETLPLDFTPIVRRTEFDFRAYLNYCTFSYSMPWWDWERWEREIDWMALHGINMPLAITGVEGVWQNTLRRLGMDEQKIRDFLAGPTYFAWQWMDNLEGWMGPLPQDWIDKHIVLGQKIVERERSLGMKPVVKGFTGYVPMALKDHFPQAKIYPTNWISTFDTAHIDPLDPIFGKIAKVFMEEQERLFGTDHYYSVDPFHESQPPVKTPEYLEKAGYAIYQAAQRVDPEAMLVIQTWSLRPGLLRSVPRDRTLMFALTGTNWKKHESYWGRPWVVGMMHNFGGRNYIGADLLHFLHHPLYLKRLPEAKNVQGLGVFPEAIEHNPIVYEAATEIAWHHEFLNIDNWTMGYVRSRYGHLPHAAEKAWQILLSTVYQQRKVKIISMESPVCARPALHIRRASMNGDMIRDYDLIALWPAWNSLLQASSDLGNIATFQYDLVDVSRQCLADLSLLLHQQIRIAHYDKDKKKLQEATEQFLALMDDMDLLLGCREEFLLGKWLADARKWGQSAEEKDYYERAAKTLITTWGPVTDHALFFDYSNRQWSGLISGFYKVRWKKFLDFLVNQPEEDNKRYHERKLQKSYDRPANNANQFFRNLAAWEQSWIDTPQEHPEKPTGNAVDIAKQLFEKWQPFMYEKSGSAIPFIQEEEYLNDVLPQLPEPNNFGL